MAKNQPDESEIHLLSFIRAHLSLPGTSLQHGHAVWLLKQFDACNTALLEKKVEIENQAKAPFHQICQSADTTSPPDKHKLIKE